MPSKISNALRENREVSLDGKGQNFWSIWLSISALFKITVFKKDSLLISEKKLSLDQLDIDGQLIDKINKFAPIKHILKNKLNNENEIIELLDDISRDLNNYDLEFRIQELESKFSQDLSEVTFNELKELKKKQNIN